MKEKSDDTSRATILETIKNEFATFRADVGGHNPERLKLLAVSAVKQGATRAEVANAAGLSTWTINNWMTKGQPKARELNLISAAPEQLSVPNPKTDTQDSVIRVRLVSGVQIDFPRSELNRELLTWLNDFGGGR